MKPGTTQPIRYAAIALGLLFAPLAAPGFAQTQEPMRFRDGRFLETVGTVTLQRANEASSDEAVMNMPFLPGDRVWTDESSRAEIVFAEGEILWIAERSKVDSLGRGGREEDERLGLRVFSGSFGVRVRPGGPGFEFRAPGGSVRTTGASAFRVDVRGGETVVTVSEGAILADLAGQKLSIRSGERVRFAEGAVDGPFRYARANLDPFDLWCEERFAELNRMAEGFRDDERLPDELDPYAGELERHGEWVYEEPQGYVYVPRVAYDWAPYTYGRWAFTLYGWTWVASEPWGFVTSHYGRWGYSANVGWHWQPRVGFSGAWVSWATPVGAWSNTVGWCALGYNDRPVSSYGQGSSGRAVPRGSLNDAPTGRGWSYANRSDLGRANLHRRRVELPAEEAQRAVVWNPGSTPDREFRETRSAPAGRSGAARAGNEEARPRGGDYGARIQVRPTPGDSLPELRSDPMTTIPTPESRRGKTIGQDGFKDEQDKKNRDPHEGSSFYGEVSGTIAPAAQARPRKSERPIPEPQAPPTGGSAAAPAGDAAKAEGNRKPTRDPLLSRFFRSITRPDEKPSSRDDNAPRSDDTSVRRREGSPPREASPLDDSSARDSAPRERRPEAARPAEPNRERPRPAGVERPQPKNPPPPQGSPRSGGSDDRAAKRKPHQER